MAKNLKLNIKNQQLAKAINLGGIKDKLAKRKQSSDDDKEKKAADPKKEEKPAKKTAASKKEEKAPKVEPEVHVETTTEPEAPKKPVRARTKSAFEKKPEAPPEKETAPAPKAAEKEETDTPTQEKAAKAPVKLGPTGRHIKDLLPVKKKPAAKPQREEPRHKKPDTTTNIPPRTTTPHQTDAPKSGKAKEYRDFKPQRKQEPQRQFDSRDRHGLRSNDDDRGWRRRRPKKKKEVNEALTIRPSSLHVRVPIMVKDLAVEMKLKASQLIATLFKDGIITTINDMLEDETTIQLLGHAFDCEITIDTSEEERIRITDKTITEEVGGAAPEKLQLRAPVVAFMGHVDHGKTSLIDAIRKSDLAAGEAGAITQHIGAFMCHTPNGNITILDTPGHEAFSSMRARGASVTDIVVLVVAGDEGIKQQTIEAIQHAKAAGVTIIVAINKCDKPGFNAENIYQQLANQDLLPESWGGTIITVNTSATTKEGITTLQEMLALQAEVLELKANPSERARGSVLESEMHKGLGAVATLLIQNGTLNHGDAVVFDTSWGRVKTMRDEHGKNLKTAGPSTPIEMTGLSGLPEAGNEFIVVKSEKEAREIAEVRIHGAKQSILKMKKQATLESLLQDSEEGKKKILNIVLRADVQGSLEALKTALLKIESEKAEVSIIATGVGEVSESDIQLAAASKALIIGFHTQIESHAEEEAKQYDVQVRLHDIIYHAIDDVKSVLTGLLDKIQIEVEHGKAEVQAVFKSSQHGLIAGCIVNDGFITRNHMVRVIRNGETIAISPVASLKRVNDDVKEVKAGIECGILLTKFKTFEVGDQLESYEISYKDQEL